MALVLTTDPLDEAALDEVVRWMRARGVRRLAWSAFEVELETLPAPAPWPDDPSDAG